MKIAEIHQTEVNEDVPLLLRAYGPTSAFKVTILTSEAGGVQQQHFIYDASLPGALKIPDAHFAEINCAEQTIRLDGRADDEANLIAGVDAEWTDWLALRPGRENRLMWDGARVTVPAA